MTCNNFVKLFISFSLILAGLSTILHNEDVARLHTATKRLHLSDAHFPLQCDKSLRLVEEVKKTEKPRQVIIHGDWIDGKEISRHPKDSRFGTLKQSFIQARESLRKLTKRGDVYICGNHEFWFYEPGNIPVDVRDMFDPYEWLEIEQQGLVWVPYKNRGKDSIYQFGEAACGHGWSATVNRTKVGFNKYICGNTHTPSIDSYPGLPLPFTCYNLACLRTLDTEYHMMKRGPTAHNKGFGISYERKSGKVQVVLFVIEDDSEGVYVGNRFYRL